MIYVNRKSAQERAARKLSSLKRDARCTIDAEGLKRQANTIIDAEVFREGDAVDIGFAPTACSLARTIGGSCELIRALSA